MTISLAATPVLTLLLAAIRIGAWLFLVPPFSSRAVPPQVRVVLSLGLAAVVPHTDVRSIDSLPGLLGAVTVQIAIGLALGFATALVIGAIAAAGSLVDVFGGFALVQGYDPLGQNMSSVFGTMHQQLAALLLFVSGGHLLVIGGLLHTFVQVPVGEVPAVSLTPEALIDAFSSFFLTAVQIALPLIGVLFVADLALALMTKVAPQLNAIGVMFPMKIGLTLLLVGLSFPVLPGVVNDAVDTVTHLMGSLQPA